MNSKVSLDDCTRLNSCLGNVHKVDKPYLEIFCQLVHIQPTEVAQVEAEATRWFLPRQLTCLAAAHSHAKSLENW